MDVQKNSPRPRDAQMFDSSSPSSTVASDVHTPVASPNLILQAVRLKKKVKAKKSSKILELICEAIKEVGVKRKGASYNAIKKWVIESGQEEKSGRLFLTHFKRGFASGIEENVLVRAGSSHVTGLRGFFVLAKETKVKAKKAPPPPKQIAKPRPKIRVSSVVLLARKKKNMAIMNGSLIQKRKSLSLSIKKSSDYGKAKKVKNPKSEDIPAEKEPGPSRKPPTAKASKKKEPKIPAENQAKAATRERKQRKAVAMDDKDNPQLDKFIVMAKKQAKTVDPAKNQSKATTKKQTETKAKTLDKTEALKRKHVTASSAKAEVSKTKLMKTTSLDKTEAPTKKQPKTKAPSKKNLKMKTPGETKVSTKEMNISLGEAEASTSKQIKIASSDKTEAPDKMQPKTRVPSKKKLETKAVGFIVCKENLHFSSSDEEAEETTCDQMNTESSNKTEAPSKRHPKTEKKNLNLPSKNNLKTKDLGDTEVSTKERNSTPSDEAEVSITKQIKTILPDEIESLAKKQPKKRAQKSPTGVPNKKQIKTISDEDGNQQNVEVPAKKQPKSAAQETFKKLPKSEKDTEKQPEVGRPTSKNLNIKEKKKEIKKLTVKIKGRKNLRRDVSDSELDVSKRTEPLKGYHSDPEVSMMDN